jgi:hypothetical protein
MDQRPDPPPEGRLIAAAADRLDLSIREAARRAGISYGRWRQIVTGYQNVSPGVFAPVHAPAKTLAKMAAVVGVTPEQMETEGQRPDVAAAMRRSAEAHAAPPLAAVPSLPDSAEALIESALSKPMRQMGTRMAEEVTRRLPGLAGRVWGAAKANPGTPVPSGAQVFGPGPDADLWDELVATGKRLAELRLTGPDGFDLEQMVQAMAMAMVQVDDSRRERRGGAVAQLIRR